MRLVTMLSMFALLSIGYLGVAPTASADDCGAACIENCEAGVGGRVTAQCEVAHRPTGVDGCFAAAPDCSYVAACWTDGGLGCRTDLPDARQCAQYWIAPDRGVCVDTGRPGCYAWHYVHRSELCLVPVPT